jgi:O-methyltransferase
MYESTIIALESLYGKLSPGGFVIIDDYHVVEGCRQAVHDFMTAGAIVADLHEIDGVGVYWRKPDGTDSPA